MLDKLCYCWSRCTSYPSGWAWTGCSGSRGPGEPVKNVIPPVGPEVLGVGPGKKWRDKILHTDYGMPVGTCVETAPNSSIFTREYTKATVQVDCAKWEGTVTMHA